MDLFKTYDMLNLEHEYVLWVIAGGQLFILHKWILSLFQFWVKENEGSYGWRKLVNMENIH